MKRKDQTNCPHCNKQTDAPSGNALRAFYLVEFCGYTQKEASQSLGVSARQVRKLLFDIPRLCRHCQGLLMPEKRELEIIMRIGGYNQMTQKEVAELYGLSIYQVKRIVAKIRNVFGVDPQKLKYFGMADRFTRYVQEAPKTPPKPANPLTPEAQGRRREENLSAKQKGKGVMPGTGQDDRQRRLYSEYKRERGTL